MKSVVWLAFAGVGIGAAAWLTLGVIGDATVHGIRTADHEIEALAVDGWRVDRFPVAETSKLVGLVKPPRDPNAIWVLGFGGNGANVTAGTRDYLARLCADRDWGLAAWAYRGFDASSGVLRGSVVASDAQAMFDRLVSGYGVSPHRVHIVGFSMGGFFAAHLGVHLRKRQTLPGSITLLSPGLTGPRVPRALAPWVHGAFQMRPLIDQLPEPLLVVAATSDTAHPVDFNAHEIRDRRGKALEYLEIEGDHLSTTTRSEAIERVRAHIERAAQRATP